MLHMLEWLCDQLMEAEIPTQIGTEKNKQSVERSSYRSEYRPRRLDTRMAPCTLWCQKSVMEVMFPSSSQKGNVVKQRLSK